MHTSIAWLSHVVLLNQSHISVTGVTDNWPRHSPHSSLWPTVRVTMHSSVSFTHFFKYTHYTSLIMNFFTKFATCTVKSMLVVYLFLSSAFSRLYCMASLGYNVIPNRRPKKVNGHCSYFCSKNSNALLHIFSFSALCNKKSSLCLVRHQKHIFLGENIKLVQALDRSIVHLKIVIISYNKGKCHWWPTEQNAIAYDCISNVQQSCMTQIHKMGMKAIQAFKQNMLVTNNNSKSL